MELPLFWAAELPYRYNRKRNPDVLSKQKSSKQSGSKFKQNLSSSSATADISAAIAAPQIDGIQLTQVVGPTCVEESSTSTTAPLVDSQCHKQSTKRAIVESAEPDPSYRLVKQCLTSKPQMSIDCEVIEVRHKNLYALIPCMPRFVPAHP
ncbi:unnamed protein product [Echinostoma caproni]|uniref:Uncharacterized protein n=1 Tax=Echinostoma caproni TaxID=27848 RepID=A0A183BAR4_9TREM|nr:unnamed protein product [Echinostoma caproni]